jgi:hypothetical protein
MFGVTGDVEAWVGNGQGWLWSGQALSCEGEVAGVDHSFGGSITQIHGPGTYALSSARYVRSVCDGKGCTLEQPFAPGSDDRFDCTVELTTAPDTLVFGAMVSGTFHCGKLFEDPGGAHSVTVYDGLIATTIQAPPD